MHEVETADLEGETDRWAREPIDLTCERPIRVVSLPRKKGSRLVLTVMHLAVDGAGAAAVAHVFGAYLHGVEPALPLDRRRDIASVLERVSLRHLPLLGLEMLDALAQPMRLLRAAPREKQYRESYAGPSWRWIVLPATEVERLKARCGTSINDVLVAAMASVAARHSRDGAVAVTYTMDLRRYRERPRLSAANTSSILTAIVPRAVIGDLPTTARGVSEITHEHRRGFAGPAFVLTPILMGLGMPHAMLRAITPWIAPIIVDLPLSRGLMVTNVGRVDDGLRAFGDAVEDIRIIGPTIRGIRTPAVVAYGFRGELHLELYAGPELSPSSLDDLERELRESLSLE